MDRLGYGRYGVQGGDVGAFVAPLIGRVAPDRVIGVHVNALVTFPTGDPADMAAMTDADRSRLAAMQEWQQRSGAYMQVQGTRPQTIAHSLTDSPAGLLAWIVEKFQDWTNPAAKLPEDAVDRDRILTDVSIYWFTATAGSAAHTYYERFNDPAMWTPQERSAVPTAVAVFPTDVAVRPFAAKRNNVVRWSEFTRGGHFAALEAPDLLTTDVREFFRALAGLSGAEEVPGHPGQVIAHRRRGPVRVPQPEGGHDLLVVAPVFVPPGGRGIAPLQVTPHPPVPGPLHFRVQPDQQGAARRGDDRAVQGGVPDLELVVIRGPLPAPQAAIHLREIAGGGPGHDQGHGGGLEQAPDRHHIGGRVVGRP